MPVEEHIEKVQKDGVEREIFSVAFSNGSLEQLRELKDFFKLPDELSVLKLGISIIQKAREENKKSE